MSEFQGYMGGDRGQGYINDHASHESSIYAARDNADRGGDIPDAHAHAPPLTTPTKTYTPAAVPPSDTQIQTPNSIGSITRFYQPEMSPFASPQFSGGHPNQLPHYANTNNAFFQQAQNQPQFPQYPVPYDQQTGRHIVGPQPPAMSGNSQVSHLQQNLPQQSHQPYPPVSYSQSIAQQQRVPNYQVNPSLVSSQPQQQPVASAIDSRSGTGSYAARSAQAYATFGVPSSANSIIPAPPSTAPPAVPHQTPTASTKLDDSPAVQAQQNRILTDCTRKVQEHAYYMKQAMDKDDLSTVLDRATLMVGELGYASSGLLTPKNYYELHMRALDDMPNLEEYFISITAGGGSKYTMKNLYDYAQFCPRVLPRLYIQISAASALIRSKEMSPTIVLSDLIEAVRCVQNPLRGLFLRHFLLQVTRDKLPDGEHVKGAHDFVLANFVEMNRLWVRIQHLPGDGKSKEQRKRRERERNELRILVGTNLVRLSQLEGVTSKLYGEVILPKILEQIVACGDPLAQAYLMDCIIQVFPDEYHIETLPILLAVCPKLRDKVNVRTIMQSLMDRLANYYADEELLDEADTNDVKKSVARDSFQMFEDCVQKVFQARGPRLVSREVIRLQTALLNFSAKCFPTSTEQISRCLGVCIDFIRQAANVNAIADQTPLLEDSSILLDEASIAELQKMLSIPLDSLALKVLELKHYSDLLRFLPWENRRHIGMIMLRAVDSSGVAPSNVTEVKELFTILRPVIEGRNSRDNIIVGERVQERSADVQEADMLVAKLVHLLYHPNTDVTYEMVHVARSHLCESGSARIAFTLTPVVFSALRLASKITFGEGEVVDTISDNDQLHEDTVTDNEQLRVNTETDNEQLHVDAETGIVHSSGDDEIAPIQAFDDGNDTNDNCEQNEAPVPTSAVVTETTLSISCRQVLLFVQNTIAMLAKVEPELGLKLYMLASVAVDKMFAGDADESRRDCYRQIVCELLAQAYALHDEEIEDGKAQQRCIVNMVGTLLNCQSLPAKDYEAFITKTAQYAAKLIRKQDQCEIVALCSHLFFSVGMEGMSTYKNPQRTLECLQRSLKLADANVNTDRANVYLFVDLLEDYLYFFELGNPVISDAYITGLVSLIKEHLEGLNGLLGLEAHAVADAQLHFFTVCEYIQSKKQDEQSAEKFARISIVDGDDK